MSNAQGKFITFEGIDGAGKTTQINLLAEHLRELGKTVYITREPGGTNLSEQIRALLLSTNNTMTAMTEVLLMFSARTEHVETVLQPKLSAGEWVICSRFTDATLAYQGYARGVDISKIKTLATLVHGDVNPDISLFLDLPVTLAAKRRFIRAEIADRFEAEEMAFMQAVREGYLTIADKDPVRCKVIDATQSAEVIANNIWHEVSGL
ncbi:MAG: dTMP kinase [Ostreibacterium sp.]